MASPIANKVFFTSSGRSRRNFSEKFVRNCIV
ncbi:Uncharacterised protein [Bordetella pertussis]|nr:Uncharacterised protein [Bordetella pertussis]CPH96740.1 Uncharacterised protein [Bordetella pertussis]CPK62917.1 Uncharacterised protein [Bordetella pertussis]CPN51177.1 Uncharacterised protein [Bordetella pertussis]